MIKLFEMFAGYGGASFALKKAEIEHEVIGYSEIDKYAIQCYEQNHKRNILERKNRDGSSLAYVYFRINLRVFPKELIRGFAPRGNHDGK